MISLVSSPERLTDSKSIELFKRIFIHHGAIPGKSVPEYFSSSDRMQVVPLVFGLLPYGAVFRNSPDTLVKPLIVGHLKSLGTTYDDSTLITVLKEIADQLYFTRGVRPVRRKMGIADLRMTYRNTYKNLRARQCERCSVCGVLLKDAEEHLDHRIPFRLLGDVLSGANWQLLCSACNIGKSSWFSALQPAVSQNWLYGDFDIERKNITINNHQDAGISLTVRYSVLVQGKTCAYPNCKNGPKDAQLRLRLRFSSALPVVDHFELRCQHHFVSTGS